MSIDDPIETLKLSREDVTLDYTHLRHEQTLMRKPKDKVTLINFEKFIE